MSASIQIKDQARKSLRRRHPWLFSGAIQKVRGKPGAGDTVEVVDREGHVYGAAAYSPSSQIRARMWHTEPGLAIDGPYFRARLERAIASRQRILHTAKRSAYRLVASESDGLPGLIVDRYADVVVCQFLSAGTEIWRHVIVEQLQALLPEVRSFYERSDVDVRKKEGLKPRVGLLAGEEPPDTIEIQEGANRYLVDVRQGHKTGYYLDQCENRETLTSYCEGAEVLNCFGYTGGFGIAALRGGAAHVTNVDGSAAALAIAAQHVTLNGFASEQMAQEEADVFRLLRKYRDEERRFDVIVLDPPKFVDTRKNLNRATRGYKDINWLACRLLRPGGLLFTFSCSGLMSTELFQKVVAGAALDAKRDVQIIRRLQQAEDHPIALHFPEGDYLKGLVCRVH